MERLDSTSNENESDLKVNIVRHGPSMYRQPEWRDIASADDLNSVGIHSDGERTADELSMGKEHAIDIIKKTAEEIASEIKPDEEVAIWSSPTGRTLETARIISDVLKQKGLKLRTKSNEHGIRIFEQIGEVKNFSWNLFKPLIDGGEVVLDDIVFTIDKKVSNPHNIPYPDYFTSDAIKEIPEEAKAKWPKEYVDQINSFESFKEVSDRMKSVLQRISRLGDKNYRVIIVTHDALTGYLVKTFSMNKSSGIKPGQFISIERKGENLVVTRAGDLLEGDNTSNVLN